MPIHSDVKVIAWCPVWSHYIHHLHHLLVFASPRSSLPRYLYRIYGMTGIKDHWATNVNEKISKLFLHESFKVRGARISHVYIGTYLILPLWSRGMEEDFLSGFLETSHFPRIVCRLSVLPSLGKPVNANNGHDEDC